MMQWLNSDVRLGDADDNQDLIFTLRETRRVSKSLTVQYDKKQYLIEDNYKSRRVMEKYIEIQHYPEGRIELRGNDIALIWTHPVEQDVFQ